jgi:hypothetical protein
MKKLLSVFTAALFFSGCYAGMGAPIPGLLFTDTKSGIIGVGEGSDLRQGVAECESILGLIATGDCSIEQAKKNGRITKVQYVDYKVKNILGVYATYQTVVQGE